MSNHKITSAQITVWILMAVVGPVIFYTNGAWLGTFLWGSILSLLVIAVLHFGCHWDGVVYNVIQLLWLSIVLSQVLQYSADCWPTGERAFPTVPLVLLTLATISALKGGKSTANGIGVLFWVIAFLLGIVIIAGIPAIKVKHIMEPEYTVKAHMLLIFLLPAVVSFLEWKRNLKLPLILVVLLSSGVAAWTSGILSLEISETVTWSFYEAAKSVQLLDVAKRLEALVSAGVTVGNYALYSFLLCGAGGIGRKLNREREAVIISSGIAASVMLLGFAFNPEILVVSSAVLWLLLPFLGTLKKKMQE